MQSKKREVDFLFGKRKKKKKMCLSLFSGSPVNMMVIFAVFGIRRNRRREKLPDSDVTW
jgi:hypothetical protein